MIKAWTVTFKGHYPVGACAVVTAVSVVQAMALLSLELNSRGLKQDIPPENFVPLALDISKASVILDGEY